MRKHQYETRPFLQLVNVAFARANLNGRIWLFQLSHQKHKWLQMYKLLTSNYVFLLTSLCLCSTFNYFWLFRKESAWCAVKLLLIIKKTPAKQVYGLNTCCLCFHQSLSLAVSHTEKPMHGCWSLLQQSASMILSCFFWKKSIVEFLLLLPRCNRFFEKFWIWENLWAVFFFYL